MVKDSYLVHDSQDLLLVLISNLDDRDSIERACVMLLGVTHVA